MNHDLETSIDSITSEIDPRFIVTLELVWTTNPTSILCQWQLVMTFHHVRTELHNDDNKHPIDTPRILKGYRQVWLVVYNLLFRVDHETTAAWTSLHPLWGVTEF